MRHSLSRDTRTYLPVETRSQTVPEPYDARSCLDYAIRVATVDGRDGTVSSDHPTSAKAYFNKYEIDCFLNFYHVTLDTSSLIFLKEKNLIQVQTNSIFIL